MSQSIVARERARQELIQRQQMNSSMMSSESSSYSSNINRSASSTTAVTSNFDGSRNYVRGDEGSRYYPEEGNQDRRGIDIDVEPEMKSIPYDGAPPGASPPPAAQEVQKQPSHQPKIAKQGKVRIVGGKLFHVEDDVEGPISIQYIGDHPNPGTRGYHVAKSSYPPPGKPREGFTADGKRMHFIA